MANDPPLRSRSEVLKDWVRALDVTTQLSRGPSTLLGTLIERAASHGDEWALIGEAGSRTYSELVAGATRYAQWAIGEGIAPGDTVGLLMRNSPDYVAIWLGLTHVGCVVALLNTQLSSAALAQCIASASAKHVIVGPDLVEAVGALIDQQSGAIQWWSSAESADTRLSPMVPSTSRASIASLANTERRPAAGDRALLIYTSGTTGLPKAANVTHARILEWSGWFAGMMNAQPEDRLYNCLPMYHSVGGVVAVGAMLVAGGAVVIRSRFSASGFWGDVARSGCTIVQYIGELCRYLLETRAADDLPPHGIRLFCGNGLRGDVWLRFQQRFNIPRILEFYAATEGNVSLYNCEGAPGAIGRVPPFLAHRFPVALIRCDVESGEVVRDMAGRCIRCAPGEAGEAIGTIGGSDGPVSRAFDRYTDQDASARKILRDVFEPGDQWFRTGDLMRKDAAGYFYFVDRLGDTFRWKGENVSTTEVAGVIAAFPGVLDVAVYGVAVPGAEGKAGMAALAVEPSFDLAELRAFLVGRLPAYARPMFIRLCQRIATTGTFKIQKGALAREGYAESASGPVWFDDRARGAFIPCDAALRSQLDTRAVRL